MHSRIGKTSWNQLTILLLFYDQSAIEFEKLNNELIIRACNIKMNHYRIVLYHIHASNIFC